MRKIEIKKEIIKTNKINSKMKLVLISDIHYSKKINTLDLERVVHCIKCIKPNYIFIAGDLIDSADLIKDKIHFRNFLDFISKLSKIAKVCICLGNHDVYKENYKTREYEEPTEYIKKINEISNVKILNNNSFKDSQLFVYGQTRDFESYTDENNKELIAVSPVANKYSILLTHSPVNIKNNTFDLTLTGHMHNGLVPTFCEKFLKANVGLVGPGKTFFPKLSRGTYQDNEKYLIISGGITKTSPSQTKLLLWLNNFYPISINEIEIIKKD